MARTRIDTTQLEPAASGSIIAVDSSGEASWQASGAASGDYLRYDGSEYVPRTVDLSCAFRRSWIGV